MNINLNNNNKDEEHGRAFQQEKKVNNMQAEFDKMRRKNEESAWEDCDESEMDPILQKFHFPGGPREALSTFYGFTFCCHWSSCRH